MNEQVSTFDHSPDSARLSKTLRTRWPFRAELVRCSPLPGDASNRRYYRLHLSEGGPSSLILMELADPEGFKSSEEAVSQNHSEITELPFLNVLNHLRRAGITVPTLHHYDRSAGLLYLEDFGDETLFHACTGLGNIRVEELYTRAIDQLVAMHVRATFSENTSCLAFGREFTDSLLMWEFEHFLEFGVVARQGNPMEENDIQDVREEFQKIADWIAAQPKVFTHRDYHSRNLMVDGERLGVIDFQDALMGPVTYDLVSLLRDSYIELKESMIDRLLNRYVDGLKRHLEESMKNTMLLNDRPAFRRLFDFTSIQRNMKAAGRFVYIDQVKGNSKFLADIPRTLGYVKKNFDRYPELQSLREHLTPYVPEFR